MIALSVDIRMTRLSTRSSMTWQEPVACSWRARRTTMMHRRYVTAKENKSSGKFPEREAGAGVREELPVKVLQRFTRHDWSHSRAKTIKLLSRWADPLCSRWRIWWTRNFRLPPAASQTRPTTTRLKVAKSVARVPMLSSRRGLLCQRWLPLGSARLSISVWTRETSRTTRIRYLRGSSWWRTCLGRWRTNSNWSREIRRSMQRATTRWSCASRRQDLPFLKSSNCRRWPIYLAYLWILRPWVRSTLKNPTWRSHQEINQTSLLKTIRFTRACLCLPTNLTCKMKAIS